MGYCLFGLSIGDKFEMRGETYTLKRIRMRRMRRIGNVPVAETITEDGTKQFFIHNWEVNKIAVK